MYVKLCILIIFSIEGHVFVIDGFEKKEIKHMGDVIKSLGGKIITEDYTGVPEFAVVPIFGVESRHTVREVVTDIFIVMKSTVLCLLNRIMIFFLVIFLIFLCYRKTVWTTKNY